MNVPLHHPPPIGSVEELREYAAQTYAIIQVYAEHAQSLAALGMDEELAATTRKMLAAAEAAALTVRDLRGRRCTAR